MGGGLAFLTKKSFNPANWSNQRQVWEARQKNETEKRRIVERDAQIKREREEEDLARVVGGEEEGGRKALGFMYEAGKIPGLERKNNNEGEEEDDGGGKISATVQGSGGGGEEDTSIYERQPGDDDAAAAFRALLARGVADDSTTNAQNSADVGAAQGALGTNPNGEDEEEKKAPDHRTALEKAVGRGINAGSSMSLAQQMERFPMLKGAPMVLQKPDGASGKDGEKEENAAANVAGLNFKPLGHMLRNVQCMVCKQWGHSRGDRECQVSGWNPFASVSAMPAAVAPVVAAAKPAPTPLPAVAKDAEKEIHDERNNKSEHKRHKKEKRRRKEDRHRKKKRKRYHKRSSRRRSPSYSSSDSDSDSSFDSYDDKRRHRRHHGRRSRHDSDESDDEGRRHHSGKESRHKKE